MNEDEIYSITASFTGPTHAVHVMLSAMTYLLSTPGNPGWNAEFEITKSPSSGLMIIRGQVDLTKFVVQIPAVLPEWTEAVEAVVRSVLASREFIAEQARQRKDEA
jgi:hypothetical protein